jgi:hypothetical protein
MLKKVQEKILSLAKVWRVIIVFSAAFVWNFFIVFPIFSKIGEILYKDNWQASIPTWLYLAVILVGLPPVALLGKWLNLDDGNKK